MADPLLQHILLIVSTFEPNVKNPTTTPVWDGATTEQTEAILDAINALGVRCRQAEADLDMIRNEHPDIWASSARRKTLDDPIDNSAMVVTTKASSTGDAHERTEETDHTTNPSSGAEPMDNVELELSAVKEEVKLLKAQIHDVTRVCTAIEQGDLDQKVEIEAEGEMLILKLALNNLLDYLPYIIREVSRVLLEIGEEGMYGGQAMSPQAREQLKGCWASFITLVNHQAANLTEHSRATTDALVKAASGDFTFQSRLPDVRGETLILRRAVTDLLKWMSAEALMEQS